MSVAGLAEGGLSLTGKNLSYVVVAAVIALVALGFAAGLVKAVLATGRGTEKMQEIAGAVQEGATAYLFRQFKTLGVFVDMGRHQAVAEMLRIRIRGFPAWFAARTYHLALMPGTTRRLRLIADWTVALFFSRGGPELGQLGHPPPLDSD